MGNRARYAMRQVARHTVMVGEGLPLIGRLLGHSRHRTTAGYAHLADGHIVEAAEKVGAIIAEAMEVGGATPDDDRRPP